MDSEYDALHFPPNLSPITHVNQIAVVARLLGLEQPALATCRVLDIGCAEGWQLTAMATAMPRASFVGIDLSATQIERAREVAEQLGATNVEYRCVDLAALDEVDEAFDYVIAHGVFSWLPEDARAGLFDLVRRSLAPTGVALVSFNTLPGWHLGQVVRDMLVFHLDRSSRPRDQVREAQRFLDLLVRGRDAGDPHATELREIARESVERAEGYFFHEYLAPENHALWFHEFMDGAQAHGLAYVGDAHFGRMLMQQLPAEVRGAVEALDADRLRTEQYIDFLTHRKFRHALLCRDAAKLGLGVGPDAMSPFRVATDAEALPREAAGDPARYRTPNGTVFAVRHRITEAALAILFDRRPLALPFEELLDAARAATRSEHERDSDKGALAGDLVMGFADWGVHLAAYDEPLAEHVAERPRAFPPAREAARTGWATIPSLRHVPCRLDPVLRRTLAHLDGTNDAGALVEALAMDVRDGVLKLPEDARPAADDAEQLRALLAEHLPRVLELLRRRGMLMRS